MIELTEEERSFLQNYLMSRYQDDSKRQIEGITLHSILTKLSSTSLNLTDEENTYIQFILQELGEIDGRSTSIANEKQPLKLHVFRPQLELSYVTSIGTKLGANFGTYNMQASDETWRPVSPLQGG